MKPLQLDKTAKIQGHALRYGVWGEGPPLVLIHGTPFNAQVWRRLLPLLARGRQVYAYDLLGYGSSDKPDTDVSLGVQNTLLAGLLDHWDLVAPDVVAHDFGGATALRAHLLDGCAYRTLTLIDPVAFGPWGSPMVRHLSQHEAGFAGLEPGLHRALVEAYVATAAASPLSPEALALYGDPWCTPDGQPAFYRQIAQMDRVYTDEIAADLHRVDLPTLLLWGEEDAWIPIARGRELAGRLPDCRFEPVPGAGHLVQEDASDALIAALLRFLP
ncbi:alpha/beta fold hydrolase [Algihabitans albus]|uniref:alpha/beta fold hydrolase n=1 Tax=Algihabitans albus TaxID=2164067 RepID=UPI000E5D51F9|nr:alpha/beta hydrolase [Algihabitans albus]